MASTFDVVLNRQARRLQGRDGLFDALVKAAEGSGARAHETRNLDELDRTAQSIAATGTDGVIFAGGDGSCMAGVSALAHAFADKNKPLPPVAFAPAGTVGTIARNIYGRTMSAEAVVADVCRGATRTVPWPSLRINDSAGRHCVGFIFGCGLVQRFFEVYDASERGLGVAAVIAARVFAGSFVKSQFARRVLAPVSCRLTIDGELQDASSFSLVVASVVRDVGLGFRVTYRAAEEHGRFHLVASGIRPESLGTQMLRVLAGRPLRGEPGYDALAGSLRVDFMHEDGGYVLDGELIRAKWVSVVAGPVLKLLVAR